jgi:hypothetical protein
VQAYVAPVGIAIFMLTVVEGVDIMLLRLARAAIVLAWGAATADITS